MRRALLLALLGGVLAGCGRTSGPPFGADTHAGREAIATAYTTRLPASDPERQAIVLAQTVYGGTREENSAGAIILCPQDERLAFTAMHRITHMPVNAPMLYFKQDGSLSQATLREMHRLHPDGVVQDGRVQVYVIGTPPPDVMRAIKYDLGYKVRQFPETDPVALAELLDRWQAAMKSDHPDEVVISAVDHPDGIAHGMGAMGWNAHMGKGFAWVNRDSVPEATHRILARRFGQKGAYLYLTGGPDVISDRVARELSRYGLVRRIQGDNPFATNATNAGYKDFGRTLGWWWGWSARSFGWGIAQAGHNYIFVNPDDLLGAIPAVLLGHMGKHGPVLLVRQNEVPESVVRYLEMVRPFPSGPTATIRNHAWIIGDGAHLSWEVQKEIHRLLTPRGLELHAAALETDLTPTGRASR